MTKRVIKFRAWDEKENKMIEWHSTFFYDTSSVTGWSGDFDDIEMPLMQFTGLLDKNGKEIYEQDIIKINFDQSYVDKSFYVGEVRYRADDGYPAFDLEPWIDCGMNALAWLKSESDESVISYEVIGNIYENLELLQ